MSTPSSMHAGIRTAPARPVSRWPAATVVGAWARLTPRERYERLLAAHQPLGHDLTPLSIAEALYELNRQAGLAPAVAPGDPPVSYVCEVGRALRDTAREHGDMRGARALDNALTDVLLGVRPTRSVPAEWQRVRPSGMGGALHALPHGVWLVPSASRACICYVVHPVLGCGCKAARCGHECRHDQLIQMIAVARERWEALVEALGLTLLPPPIP